MEEDLARIRQAFDIDGPVTFQWLTRTFPHFECTDTREGIDKREHPLSGSALFVVDGRWYKMIRGG